MAGVPVARANARDGVDPGLVFHRPERTERCDRVGLRINRLYFGATARRVAPVEGGDLGFLDAARVGEKVSAQIDGAARGDDRSRKAIADQLRQQTTVVDMGVRQQHGIDIGRPKRKGGVVERLQGFRPLEQAAVDQQAPGLGLKQIAGAGHGPRGAAKFDRHAHDASPREPATMNSRRRASASSASSSMALVGCGTLWVERIDRRPASKNRAVISGGNNAWVMMASTVLAPAATSALVHAKIVPPDDTISSTRTTGRPANMAGSANVISTERSLCRVLRATA